MKDVAAHSREGFLAAGPAGGEENFGRFLRTNKESRRATARFLMPYKKSRRAMHGARFLTLHTLLYTRNPEIGGMRKSCAPRAVAAAGGVARATNERQRVEHTTAAQRRRQWPMGPNRPSPTALCALARYEIAGHASTSIAAAAPPDIPMHSSADATKEPLP